MKATQPNEGLVIHRRSSILVEYCYDYQEEDEDSDPKLSKLLPKEAEKDIPKYYLEASRKLAEARREWEETDIEWKNGGYFKWKKEDRKWAKADYKWEGADRNLDEAYNKWPQSKKDAFHAKWCGCEGWNGKELSLIWAWTQWGS